MKIFITGGTGTLGKELLKRFYGKTKRLIVFSRDEQKQHELRNYYPDSKEIRYFLGDVRDYERLERAMSEMDIVIHTAAMKHIHLSEYNPDECIKTNIIGSMNIVRACNSNKIKKAILISTDKAVNPINIYGASKLCAEKYFIQGNNLGKCRFSVCRYGNVLNSKGSILDMWAKNNDPIKITDFRMSRFWFTIEDAASFILDKINIMQGGEVFVPKMSISKVVDLAKKYYPDREIEEIPIRPGEKIYESLINEEESRNGYEDEKGFILFPSAHDWIEKFEISQTWQKLPSNFSLTSKS